MTLLTTMSCLSCEVCVARLHFNTTMLLLIELRQPSPTCRQTTSWPANLPDLNPLENLWDHLDKAWPDLPKTRPPCSMRWPPPRPPLCHHPEAGVFNEATLPCRHERQWRPHPLLMPLFDVIFLVNKSDLINWLRLGCYLESFFFYFLHNQKRKGRGVNKWALDLCEFCDILFSNFKIQIHAN